jgi:hypothetical protein
MTTEKITLELTLEELKHIDNSIARCDHTSVLKDKIKDAYPLPKMNFELGGKFEIVSYNGENYLRLQFNDESHNWFKRKHTVDGVVMVAITDGETQRLLEGLWYNDIRRGK